MKNVFLMLVLFGGLAISGLQAQNCQPCPPCPACPKGCCAYGGNKAASASAQLMPATLDIFAAYSPVAKSSCQGNIAANKEMKACQPSCTSGKMASCQSAAASTFQPSAQPAIAMNDKTAPAAKSEKN